MKEMFEDWWDEQVKIHRMILNEDEKSKKEALSKLLGRDFAVGVKEELQAIIKENFAALMTEISDRMEKHLADIEEMLNK